MKKTIRRACALVLSLALLVPTALSFATTVEAAGSVKSGVYVIKSAIDSRFVLDISDGSIQDRANLQLWTNNGTAAQQFVIQPISGTNQYYITNVLSKKNIDAANGATMSGTNVWQWRQNGSPAQRFRITPVGNGQYEIENVGSGLCLDASGGVAARKTNVQLWRKNHTPAQRWYLTKVGSTSDSGSQQSNQQPSSQPNKPATSPRVKRDGVYEVVSSVNQNYVLDVDGGSTKKGANLQLWPANGSPAQKFRLTYKNGQYYIQNVQSKLCVDAEMGGTKRGTNVWQWPENGSPAQQYRLHDVGNGLFEIENVGSGLYLDVSNGVAKKKANVQLWTGNHSAAQRWYLRSEKTELEMRIDEECEKVYAKVGRDLRACYEYCVNFSYFGNYITSVPDGYTPTQYFGLYGLEHRGGNCYMFAAAFCLLAKGLGYDAHFVMGYVPNARGGSTTHGWVEIDNYQGGTYVFDPDFEYEYRQRGMNYSGWKIYYGQSMTWRYTGYSRVE